MNEETLVAWLRRRTAGDGGGRRGSRIGDDTAELPRLSGRTIVTVDQQIEGIHFQEGLDPAIVARRLLAVNLSDLAASGAIPRHAFLAVAAPEEFDHRRFFTALLAACRRHGTSLSGGDLATSVFPHFSLTLLGEKRSKDATLGRDRARPGHRIWIGGTLGESALGCWLLALGATPRGRTVALPGSFPAGADARRIARAVQRHLRPAPQLELGRWLAALGPRRAGAAIDVSDGFAKDLHRICDASGVGAEIDGGALMAATAPGFEPLCEAFELDPAALVESGGEDYVLLFTLPPGLAPPSRFGARAIGTVTRRREVVVVDPEGDAADLAPRGWDHLQPAE